MEKNTKNIIIFLAALILIFPMFLGLYRKYIFIQIINIYTLLGLFGGLVMLLGIGELIDVFIFDSESLKLIKKKDIIQALITKKERSAIIAFFLITMILEELIFRYYFLSFLYDSLSLDLILVLFISSLIFCLFHIHIWFTYKNLRILGVFLCNSFILGFFLGFIYLTLGFFFCIIIHSLVALLLYFNLYNRYFKMKLNQN